MLPLVSSCAGLGVALSLVMGAAILVPAPTTAVAGKFVRLSDEQTRTHSAHVLGAVWVRRSPSRRGRRVGRVRTTTYHGSPEVVLMLGVRTVAGRTWAYIRYSGVGSRRGWVPVSALSSTTTHSERLVLDRRSLRLRLYRGRRLLFGSPVGIGAPGSPTPRGRYYIRERLGPFSSDNSVYGSLAFGLSAFSRYRTDWPGGGQVGIHGTNQPALLPGRISNGCVRLTNGRVRRLGRLLEVGTPLLVK